MQPMASLPRRCLGSKLLRGGAKVSCTAFCPTLISVNDCNRCLVHITSKGRVVVVSSVQSAVCIQISCYVWRLSSAVCRAMLCQGGNVVNRHGNIQICFAHMGLLILNDMCCCVAICVLRYTACNVTCMAIMAWVLQT